MARKDSDLTSLVKEGAQELRGAVETALAERPVLVLGLALELGLLAGHWVRGGKVSVLDVAKRALAVSPQSVMASILPVAKKPTRRRKIRVTGRRKSKAVARKTSSRRKPTKAAAAH